MLVHLSELCEVKGYTQLFQMIHIKSKSEIKKSKIWVVSENIWNISVGCTGGLGFYILN